MGFIRWTIPWWISKIPQISQSNNAINALNQRITARTVQFFSRKDIGAQIRSQRKS